MSQIRDAATVMLLRPAPAGAEVLLLRRHPESGFFADAYAFPGGKLDEADFAAAALGRLPAGFEPRLEPAPGRELSQQRALGLYFAACRELFEEAGIMLARGWRAPSDVAALREAVHSGELSFAALLERFDLTLDVASLAYVLHLVTPSGEARRFDARFFLTVAPAGQEASRDTREITDVIWRPPAAVLAGHERGELMLPPPTFLVLQELARALVRARPEQVVAEWGARRVQAVLPKVLAGESGATILLPWDSSYEACDGEALTPPPIYDAGLTDGPSRIEMVGGRWRSRRVASRAATQ